MTLSIASVSIESRWMLMLGLLLLAAILATALLRPIAFPSRAKILVIAGLILLALAAGGIVWHRPDPRQVTVMVDLSASTRGALYRRPAELRRRIDQLVGASPYRVLYFAQAAQESVKAGDALPDLPADRTILPASSSAAILLFSDGRFEAPLSAPPTYAVVDPLLDGPADASVQRLEERAQSIAATVRNTTGSDLRLLLTPGNNTAVAPAHAGVVLTLPAPQHDDLAARFEASDAWPENDQLVLRRSPPALSQRWWIGEGDPPPGTWRRLEPAQLPLDAEAYLVPSAIVLSNVPAAALSEPKLQRIQQYVRDLGGALAILGGDRAFAAGEYTGTILQALSPLSSDPPAPTTHWIVFADSSGSMAGSGESPTPWDRAKQAMLNLLPALPPDDIVSLGSFAAETRWWSRGKSAAETIGLPLPPPDVTATGTTNLEPALLKLIAEVDAALPKELLLLTDAEAELRQISQIEAGLKEKKVRLNLLAIGRTGSALQRLTQLVETTGGSIVVEQDPEKWPQAARRLLALASPERIVRQPVTIQYREASSALPARSIEPWNRTWLKRQATLLADAATQQGPAPLVARWNVGASGQVLSAAFTPTSAEASALVSLIAQPPRDPRFKVSWDPGAELRVVIEALDGATFLNAQRIALQLSDPSSQIPPAEHPVPQVAPGRYELSLPAPRQPLIATLRHDQRILDRLSIAGRFAPEFNDVGNDLPSLRKLAERTGGAVIPPTQTTPIRFEWPRRRVPLTPWLAAAGALLIATALMEWRRR